MLASSGVAIATMISGTIEWPEDGVRTEFYQEDIWQIISDITPDTKAEKKLLSKNDIIFVKKVGKYQKKISKLENKADVRELNEKQANRLLKWEDDLLQLLNSRNLLDSLLLAELDSPNELVLNDQTDNIITDNTSQESQHEASVPEPSTLTLLALGLLCLGVAHGKHACRPWV
jgi:PEP-CTERM motif